METAFAPRLLPMMPAPPVSDGLPFSVPARRNPRLQTLAEAISADEELRQLWRCANVNAMERQGLEDCGETHVRIVANAGLKLLRLLRDAGRASGAVAAHRLDTDDAEVIVVLAAALHDLGPALYPQAAGGAWLPLAERKAREVLAGLYPVREQTIVLAETMHAVSAAAGCAPGLTLEAGVLMLADALDVTKVRAPGGAATLAEEVTIQRAKQPPVRVVVRMKHPGGLAPLEALLARKLKGAGMSGLVEIAARLEYGGETRTEPVRDWEDEQ